MQNYKHILDLFAEVGMLKRTRRSGWWVIGVPDVESVAEHSFRCAIVAYFLAKMEGVEPYRVVMMALFNDIHEARIGDLHKVGHRYIDFSKAEKEAFVGQINRLPSGIKNELVDLRVDYDLQKTTEALIARDADILECLIQAKEYQEHGFSGAERFFKKAPNFLKTKSAKNLWKTAKVWSSHAWWERLSTFKR